MSCSPVPGVCLVARVYAGILGPLAMVTAIAHGLVHRSGTESTLWTAWLSLWTFALLGFVLGSLGGWMVEQSVRARIAAEIAAEEA